MSSSSSSATFVSLSEDANDDNFGIPLTCRCGERVVLRTSRTVRNPGRLFHACINGSEGGGHTFRWTDEAVVEEIQAIKAKLGESEKLIDDMKGELKALKLLIAGIGLGFVYWIWF